MLHDIPNTINVHLIVGSNLNGYIVLVIFLYRLISQTPLASWHPNFEYHQIKKLFHKYLF